MTSKAQLLSPRSATAAVFDGNDTIYVFGGWYYDPELELIPYADIHAYNITSDTIQVIAQLPRTSWNGIVHFDKGSGDIYLLRGDGTYLWRFDPSTGVTSSVSQWFGNSGSITGSFTADGKKIVTFGGLEGPYQIYEFDFTTQTQGPIGTLPRPSELSIGIHLAELNSTFLFAGELGDWNPVLMRYDHPSNATTVLTEVNFPSWRHGDGFFVSVNNGRNNTDLFLVGAAVENGARGNGFIQYTPATSEIKFSPLQGLPEGLTDVSAVYVQALNRIYIFGGYDFTNTDRAEIWYVDLV